MSDPLSSVSNTRTRIFLLLVTGAVFVAVIAGCAPVSLQSAVDEESVVTVSAPAMPKGDYEQYDGAIVGFTEEGDPFQGNPDAPISIKEFSDYLCPFCARHFGQTWPRLRETYVLTGRARYVFSDFPIPSLHPTATQGHVAIRCVGEQGAALFWAMHDDLFASQGQT